MKKHDKIFKKYLVTIAFIFCAFGLLIGITQAANKTSDLTKGTTEEVITDDVISDYIVEKCISAIRASYEYKG